MAKKGIDSTFLHYGIKRDDMEIVEQVCNDSDIDAEWMKEKILKVYQEERKSDNLDEKKVAKIINKALKSL
ncbi:MAG: hypothetical protein MJZ28_06755 [Paludibacteraceae bacterium]|nr:hypothetical protein [Paludibacteraceae bacterium]